MSAISHKDGIRQSQGQDYIQNDNGTWSVGQVFIALTDLGTNKQFAVGKGDNQDSALEALKSVLRVQGWTEEEMGMFFEDWGR